MRSRWGDERGSVTAEFAVALPAVVLVLATVLAGMQAATTLVRATDASAQAARMAARGDEPAAARMVAEAVPGAELGLERGDGLVCARVSLDVAVLGLLGRLPISARSCAGDGGR